MNFEPPPLACYVIHFGVSMLAPSKQLRRKKMKNLCKFYFNFPLHVVVSMSLKNSTVLMLLLLLHVLMFIHILAVHGNIQRI